MSVTSDMAIAKDLAYWRKIAGEAAYILEELSYNVKKEGCLKPLAHDQWFTWCGETDMRQTLPALCTECGGTYKLKETENDSR